MSNTKRTPLTRSKLVLNYLGRPRSTVSCSKTETQNHCLVLFDHQKERFRQFRRANLRCTGADSLHT